ncbi:MAG TPA: hypothetical protein VE011_03030 [Candidatus Dormibacteraeota bacterium]|nr:hypothetical protein [Candidatus Dormibacteraeota bacterium]
MNWLANAWRAGSRNQKIVIVIAALVTLGAIGGGLSPRGSETTATALATPTAAPGSAAPTKAATTSSAEPTPFAISATSTPLSEPTVEPAVAPTPVPTPKPTPKPTPASLALAFTSLTSPISPGSLATAAVKTSAGAYCTIVVEYKSGPSTAAGLGPTDASSSGVASWTWKVGSRTAAGSWPVTVSCSKGGAHKSVTKDLTVL